VRIKNVVRDAGGAQIWIKHPARGTVGKSPDASLLVARHSAAYHAVLSAVQQESRQDNWIWANLGEKRRQRVAMRPISVLRNAGSALSASTCGKCPACCAPPIVIDDMGRDLGAAHKLLALDYPLTFSVLPHLRYSQTTAQEAHRRGHEVMLHLPMEPESAAHASPPGKGPYSSHERVGGRKRGAGRSGVRSLRGGGETTHGLARYPGCTLMVNVMKTLADERLYFIDSRTTAASAALEAARSQHLPAFYRAVFLDDTETVSYTLGQLRAFRHAVEQEVWL